MTDSFGAGMQGRLTGMTARGGGLGAGYLRFHHHSNIQPSSLPMVAAAISAAILAPMIIRS